LRSVLAAMEVAEQARQRRAAARQARRLAGAAGRAEDRERILAYAAEMEAQADALENRPDRSSDRFKKERPPDGST
jgi:hypothetical protein